MPAVQGRIMNKFIIENFYRTYGKNRKFPNFLTLTEMETQEVLENLIKIVICPKIPIKHNDILDSLESMSKRINANPESEEFNFGEMLKQSNIISKEKVFICVDDIDIDVVKLSVLDKHFSVFWAPSSTNLVVFDETFEWVCLVMHYSEVRIVKKYPDKGDGNVKKNEIAR